MFGRLSLGKGGIERRAIHVGLPEAAKPTVTAPKLHSTACRRLLPRLQIRIYWVKLLRDWNLLAFELFGNVVGDDFAEEGIGSQAGTRAALMPTKLR